MRRSGLETRTSIDEDRGRDRDEDRSEVRCGCEQGDRYGCKGQQETAKS